MLIPIPSNIYPEEWLSTKDAASFLGVTVPGVHIALARGKMDYFKFGRDFFISKTDVEAYKVRRKKIVHYPGVKTSHE